jgi:hypothetical protein
VKFLSYVWGTVEFIFELSVFMGRWGSIGSLFAIFGSPVAIFVAPCITELRMADGCRRYGYMARCLVFSRLQ